jgi:hypothetical protein
MRPESVRHEFVNATIRPANRYRFKLDSSRWNLSLAGADRLLEATVCILWDWGAGLELGLYEACLIHWLGGEAEVLNKIPVQGERGVVGQQLIRFAADGVAFKLTAFNAADHHFEEHAWRLLRHVDLKAMLWINIDLEQVTFTSIERDA